MKKYLITVLLLLCATASQAGVFVGFGESGGTCSTTPFFEQTADSVYDNFTTAVIQAQGVANSINRKICRVSLELDNTNGSATNVTLAVRTSYNGGGTLLGEAKTVAVASGQMWTDWVWDSNYPETDAEFFINVTAAATGVWWGADASTNQNIYHGGDLAYQNYAWRLRVYALD